MKTFLYWFLGSRPADATHAIPRSRRTGSSRKTNVFCPSLEGRELESWLLLSGVTLITHIGGAAAVAAFKQANLQGNTVVWDLPKGTVVDNLGGVTLNVTTAMEITSLHPLTLVNGSHTLFNFLPGSAAYLHGFTATTSGAEPTVTVNGGTLTTQNLTLSASSPDQGTGISIGPGGDYSSKGGTAISGYGTGISVTSTGTITDTWNPAAPSPQDSIANCHVGVSVSGSGFVGIDYTNIVSCGVGLQDNTTDWCFFNAGSFANDGVAENVTLGGTYSFGEILNSSIVNCGTATSPAVNVVIGSTSYLFLSQVTISPANDNWVALHLTGGTVEIQNPSTVHFNGRIVNNGSQVMSY